MFKFLLFNGYLITYLPKSSKPRFRNPCFINLIILPQKLLVVFNANIGLVSLPAKRMELYLASTFANNTVKTFVQVILCQKYTFLNQLIQTMTTTCSLNDKLSTCCVHQIVLNHKTKTIWWIVHNMYWTCSFLVNFIHSEKATKFCEIFILILTTVHKVKSKVKISQNFVALSEYMNFT